jgi:hypothetical protein
VQFTLRFESPAKYTSDSKTTANAASSSKAATLKEVIIGESHEPGSEV